MEVSVLVITRYVGESIVIDDNITIRIEKIKGGQVRLSVDAPRDIPVFRKELVDGSRQDNSTNTRKG